MSVFKCDENFKRELNIEFKHGHKSKPIEKDILKLLCEDQDGAFILLLDKIGKNTLSSVYKKIFNSLDYKNIKNARVKLIKEYNKVKEKSFKIAEEKDIELHLEKNKDKKVHIIVMSLQNSKSKDCESSQDLYLIYHQINFSKESKQNWKWVLGKNIKDIYDCAKQNSNCCENKVNECECYEVEIGNGEEKFPFIIEHCCICKVT
jgi:hypothetical protein